MGQNSTIIMKHWMLTALLLPTIACAQKEFPKIWEAKFTVDADWKSCTDDLQYVIGGDMSEVEMLDGNTGKSLWTYNFKEKNGVKKCENMKMDDASGTLEVTLQQNGKDAPLETFHLDFRTGQPVGESELTQREVKIKTRVRRQGWCHDEATDTWVETSYDSKLFMNAGGGTKLNITVEASGGNKWKANFTGKVVRHLNNDMLPSSEGQVILSVTSGQGKVFVVYEGITCIDITTGKILWTTTFDNVQISGGLKIVQEIGRSAMPLIAADGVYVCDFTKGERTIKKLDLATGAVIWSADKLKQNDIVSKLILDGGNLIARFGGLIRIEEYIPGMNGNPSVYKVKYSFEGSSALHAFDAATGRPTWDTEAMELGDNFKKSECTVYGSPGRVYACGDKNIYIFESATGKVLNQAGYDTKAIGKASALYPFHEAIMIEGEKGVAQVDAELAPKYATNTGKCLMTEFEGDAFIVWTGKKPDERNEFVRLDPATGTIMGNMSDCRWPHFDTTGDRFVMFDGKKAMMYRTN